MHERDLDAGGTYLLEIAVAEASNIEVGALGPVRFAADRYAYVGSAFGPGGLAARVGRHRELAAGERESRHWHVDYLLGHGETSLVGVVAFADEDRECELASALPGEPVDGFGASDCDCAGHLLAVPSSTSVREAGRVAGGRPTRF